MKRAGVCFHFRGVQHIYCMAGVPMLSMRDDSATPYRWPCMDRPCATSCAKYREPTADEIAADRERFDARIAELRAQTERGECQCGTKVVSVRQVGSCVYATPCGCRIGQGDAKQVAQALGCVVARGADERT